MQWVKDNVLIVGGVGIGLAFVQVSPINCHGDTPVTFVFLYYSKVSYRSCTSVYMT